jgi:hypothetical protein
MKRGSKILVKISFILISFLLIDGGKVFILIGDNIHFVIEHEHNADLEIPGHENSGKIADGEKWMNAPKNELISLNNSFIHISYIRDLNPRDFSTSIWQPPKFI